MYAVIYYYTNTIHDYYMCLLTVNSFDVSYIRKELDAPSSARQPGAQPQHEPPPLFACAPASWHMAHEKSKGSTRPTRPGGVVLLSSFLLGQCFSFKGQLLLSFLLTETQADTGSPVLKKFESCLS